MSKYFGKSTRAPKFQGPGCQGPVSQGPRVPCFGSQVLILDYASNHGVPGPGSQILILEYAD